MPQYRFAAGRVQREIVRMRLDAVDVVHRDATHLPADFQREVFEGRAAGCGRSRGSRRQVAPDPQDRFEQPFLRNGLDEVVAGIDLEGARGVIGVGGDEDHARQRFGQQVEHGESIRARHFDIEEQGVDGVLAQGLDEIEGARAVRDDLDVGFARQQPRDARAGQEFVVGDRDPQESAVRCVGPGIAAGDVSSVSQGMSMITHALWSLVLRIWKSKSSP